MSHTLKVGLIGDPLPEYQRPQSALLDMIGRASTELNVPTEMIWVPTPMLEDRAAIETHLGRMDALWAVPGSPYRSLDGALNGIGFARQRNWPFIGTCAGFQHTVLEYARNVMGIADAAHQEYDPEAATLLLTALVCPIATKTLQINLLPGSRVAQVYGQTAIKEYYYCNFGINPAFQQQVDDSGLKVTGSDQNGEPRVVELPEHRFFIATLFVPGASFTEGLIEMPGAHPLIKAWLQAGVAFRKEKVQDDAQPLAAY